ADPASRTSCKYAPAPPGTPPGSQMFTCRNITMAQFADRLQGMAPELSWPVVDATEIEGGWDFSLTYSRNAGMMFGGGRGGDAGSAEGGMPAATEPTGVLNIFEAMEKQLGLKLEMHKRPMPVIVIDHLEQKPTEN
ncbi:MAG TPA: TIGR03435 family protein, partial [Bryobacteraceae bacterium]|nr:TIGR03435 family protein [Bryobacteraceae bacterium]